MDYVVAIDMSEYGPIQQLHQEVGGNELGLTLAQRLDEKIFDLILQGRDRVNIQAPALYRRTGDGAHVMFKSADDAVKFSEGVQSAAKDHNNVQKRKELQIPFRIGIELGQVYVEGTFPENGFHRGEFGGQVVSDAVRFEAGCPIGGIQISNVVYDRLSEDLAGNYKQRTFTDKHGEKREAWFREIYIPTSGKKYSELKQQIKETNQSLNETRRLVKAKLDNLSINGLKDFGRNVLDVTFSKENARPRILQDILDLLTEDEKYEEALFYLES